MNVMQALFRVRQVQKRKKNEPRSTGKAKEKQQQNFSLNNDEIEELSSWIFSTQEAAQVEAEIRPQVFGSPRVKLLIFRKGTLHNWAPA